MAKPNPPTYIGAAPRRDVRKQVRTIQTQKQQKTSLTTGHRLSGRKQAANLRQYNPTIGTGG